MPVFQQHPHVSHWSDTPCQSSHTVLAMELIKRLPKLRFLAIFPICLCRLLGSCRLVCTGAVERMRVCWTVFGGGGRGLVREEHVERRVSVVVGSG